MQVYRRSSWLLVIFVELQLFFIALQGVHGELNTQDGPSESECRPYIEKALKQLETGDAPLPSQDDGDSQEDIPTIEITTDDSDQPDGYGENEDDITKTDSNESNEVVKQDEHDSDSNEKDDDSKEDDTEEHIEHDTDDPDSEEQVTSDETVDPEVLAQEPDVIPVAEVEREVLEQFFTQNTEETAEKIILINDDIEEATENKQDDESENPSVEASDDGDSNENDVFKKGEVTESLSKEREDTVDFENQNKDGSSESREDIKELPIIKESLASIVVEDLDRNKEDEKTETASTGIEDNDNSNEEATVKQEREEEIETTRYKREIENSNESESKESEDATTVEELIEGSEEVILDLRPRDHIPQLLKLDEDSTSASKLSDRMSEIILRDLKKLYENAIKPLETLYKYKDLSNRHYGDPEIFAKPLVLFMGPWSGGKSSIINYLLGLENTQQALHTGAEPSPAYFNILMYGDNPEILDGTQLAADYTFSGLQKFGQGLEERLRGYRLPSKLLEKVNIVEIPGILEVRKQVSRVFPFNDACQWFIDRADIIFLVYDPSKLDVGPETEAILDQLKGREHQTRIVLNKADQVKPEELMRVQGALIWNISPLMSSAQPPIIYTTSLWSNPYEVWAPVRLLQAQERALLRDIRSAVDKAIDNKIASARRFAVRVRNHAKMVDCYLTTYYNHKSVFGNRKQVSDEIINHPQDFHIYEGLSTLTNISRYDLPDPDVYRDFFRLNALYEFQQLSATCTYFRGCPINRLDIAIAYDLPELVGKHKKLIETAINEANKPTTPKS